MLKRLDFNSEAIQPTKEEFQKHSSFCKEYEQVYQEVNIEFTEEKLFLKPKLSVAKDFTAFKKNSLQAIREKEEKEEEYSFLKFKSFSLGPNNPLKPRTNSIFKLLENNMDQKRNSGEV